MTPTTAALLDAARKRSGLSQEAVAAAVGVKQQTVSRWMAGEAAPRAANLARLAEVLGLSVSDIQVALGADRRGLAAPVIDEPPVRPLTAALPFSSLPADRFEHCVADLLVRLYPTAQVSLLGGQGDDQQGFDIQVSAADGTTTLVQCKRESQFGPKKIAKAVADGERTSELRIIALARTATAAARFELQRHPRWRLWDQMDLSRQVRTLPPESAHRLVQTYFPNHVEDFLGLAPSGPWMTLDEFFRNMANTVLDHDQELVGRSGLMEDVCDWVTDVGDSEIGVIVGRGGLGKSKLLHDVAAASGAWADVRFLAVGQTPAPSDFALLPSGRPLLVVLDDAHSIEGVAGIAAQLQQHRPGAKLLLACRPYGEAALDQEIWRLGQTPRRARRWRLTDLTDAEARELVAGLTHRSVHDPATRQLAAVSFDCPFIAVVAADLMSRGELSAHAFASDSGLRREVVSRYGKQLASTGSGQALVERQAVLRALAAYQPVRLNDPPMTDAVNRLSKMDDPDEVNGRIRELEDLGLVLRRGDSVRVVPDMLGDVLLAEAAFDERRGTPTSFVGRAHQAASGTALQHLVVNVARIDWQLRDGGAPSGRLVDQLWESLEQELLSADFNEQVSLLQLSARIAYYQPDRALQLVRAVLDLDVEDTARRADPLWPWRATRRDVINALAPVLKAVGYHLEHLPEALDLLWALAQVDDRPTNQFPDHPTRVLTDMADLQTGKPFSYLHAVIDAAESWATEPSKLSPFVVLEPMLAVEATDQVSSGSTLTFHTFGLAPDTVREVRSRVIDLALNKARAGDAVTAVRAVNALGAAIRGPHGMFGRKPSEAEVQDWAEDAVPTIVQLSDIGADGTRDPAVRIAIRRALRLPAADGPAVKKAAAAECLSRLHRGFLDDVAMCIHDGWGHLARRVGEDYQVAEHARQAEFQRVASELVDGRSPVEVLDLLEERLRIERATLDGINSAGRFLWDVFTAAPPVATVLLESANEASYPELMAFASIAIGALAEQGREEAIQLAMRSNAAGDLVVRRGVASALSWNRGNRQGLLPGELDLLIEMAGDDDESVRAAVGRAVFLIARTETAPALQVLSRIEFRGSGKVASEALSVLTPAGPMSWADTDHPLQRAILDQLVGCMKIDEYDIMAALSELSRIDPLSVTRMLMARVDRSDSHPGVEYEALPRHWDPPLRVQETPQLRQCLMMIRDWLTVNPPTALRSLRGDDGATLYSRVCGSWSDQAFAVLEISDASSEAQTNAVAHILSRVPLPIFLTRVDLVVGVCRRAASMAQEARDNLLGRLLPTNGVVTVWVGEQTDQDVDERDQARRIAADLPRGSLERRFFSLLADALDGRIRLRAAPPERDLDGRHW